MIRDGYELYKLVFSNQFLCEKIYGENLLLNINKYHRIQTLKTLLNFPKRKYLEELEIIPESEIDKVQYIKNNKSQEQYQSCAVQENILEKDHIPPNVKSIVFNINLIIKENDIPDGIKSIKFFDEFKEISLLSIPISVNDITFGKDTNVVDLLPTKEGEEEEQIRIFKNVNYIKFDWRSQNLFNSKSTNLNLFPNLKTLFINSLNNDNELIIPNSVTSLYFGKCFNNNLPIIPSTVKIIKLGYHYHREIQFNQLPENLESFTCCSSKSFNLNDFYRFKNIKSIICRSTSNKVWNKEEIIKTFSKIKFVNINCKTIINRKSNKKSIV